MKKTEREILKSFETSSMQIEPKFRKQLRKQVMAQSRRTARRGNQRSWARYALVPAVFVLAVLMLGVVTFDTKSGSPKIASNKVSAEEIVRRAEAYQKQLQSDDFTFFVSERGYIPGPQEPKCVIGIGDKGNPAGPGVSQSSSDYSYVYRDKDYKIEASYSRYSGADGTIHEHSVYDDTTKQIMEDYHIPTIDTQDTVMDKVFGNYVTIDSYNPAPYVIVNAQGKEITDLRVAPTIVDGREVYEFYNKINTDAMSPLRCATDVTTWEDKEDPTYGLMAERRDINRILIDAKTYQLVRYEAYVDSYAPENLINISTYNLEYKNISANEALAIMTKAGFDKETALTEFSGGHD